VEADVAEVRSRLEEQQTRRALPLLDAVRVASPCNMRWDDMVGDGRVRYCGKCEKNVYNVAYMTRDEAETLMHEHEGELCMRIYRRADGTVITSDCPVKAQRKERRNSLLAIAIGSSLAAGAVYALEGTDPLPQIARSMHTEKWASELDPSPVTTETEVDYTPVRPHNEPGRPRPFRATMGVVFR